MVGIYILRIYTRLVVYVVRTPTSGHQSSGNKKHTNALTMTTNTHSVYAYHPAGSAPVTAETPVPRLSGQVSRGSIDRHCKRAATS